MYVDSLFNGTGVADYLACKFIKPFSSHPYELWQNNKIEKRICQCLPQITCNYTSLINYVSCRHLCEYKLGLFSFFFSRKNWNFPNLLVTYCMSSFFLMKLLYCTAQENIQTEYNLFETVSIIQLNGNLVRWDILLVKLLPKFSWFMLVKAALTRIKIVTQTSFSW